MTDPRTDFGDHGGWDALAVGWALSALEPDDEARLAAHLPGCARCTETVREAVWTVTDLAYAVPDETPPRRLKRQILELAAAEPRRSTAWDPGADPQPSPTDEPSEKPTDGPTEEPTEEPAGWQVPVVAAGQPPADVVPLVPRRRRWIARTAVAAGVALIAALGVWNVQLRSHQDDLLRIVAQRDELVARLTEAGPAQIAIIQRPGGAGPRYATVVVKDGRIGLITETLPTQPGDVTYWLWGLRSLDDDSPVPLAGFKVPETLFSACNIEPPAGAEEIRAFAISAEPGPERPTKPTDEVGRGAATIG